MINIESFQYQHTVPHDGTKFVDTCTIVKSGCGFANSILISAFGGENQYVVNTTAGHAYHIQMSKVCADDPIQSFQEKVEYFMEEPMEIIDEKMSEIDNRARETLVGWLPESLSRHEKIRELILGLFPKR